MKGRKGRKTERTIALVAEPGSIGLFEDFVDGLGFLSPGERNRLKLAGGEILDNIVKHAAPVKSRKVYARAAARSTSVLLGFFFHSSTFASFAGMGGPLSAQAEPLFDPAHRRWRGIGLLMCRNLARRVAFRPGRFMDRIFLEFAREPQTRA